MKRWDGQAPSYDLGRAKQLVETREYFVSHRSLGFVKNHYGEFGSPGDIVGTVFVSMREDDFRETYELDRIPGVMADVYNPIWDDERWYVKFRMEDESDCVVIMSCNWDGYIH